MVESKGFYPGRAPIEAYGDGGFRFADMSHRGSLLLLPSGIYAWPVAAADGLSAIDFEPVFAEAPGMEFLLFGTGATQHFPSPGLRQAFQDKGLGLEFMTTGAACRTYNVLLAEGRAVAAALVAVG